MAGTITHLVIADQLLEPLQIRHPALFYCGNLAPDAIMAREGYQREMKRHTHFKDGVRLNDLHLPEPYDRYRRTFRAFAEQYLHRGSPDYELYLGYVTHMLADEVFILTLRDRFVRKLTAEGRDTEDPANYASFSRDVDLNDWQLVREYAFRYPMPDILLQEQQYEIRNYITCQELQDSKRFIIHKNFLTPHEQQLQTAIPFAENQEYIQNACSYIQKEIRYWTE